jgi:hypothetical protein
VIDIAEMLIEEMGLQNTKLQIEGTRRAWPGDQPRVHFTVDRITALGWRTRLDSHQSVRVAIRRMLGKSGSAEWVL